jgi:choline transport protein
MQQSRLTIASSANTQGLVDGGIAGLLWTYVWTFLGFGVVMMCLAEMASM